MMYSGNIAIYSSETERDMTIQFSMHMKQAKLEGHEKNKAEEINSEESESVTEDRVNEAGRDDPHT